MFFFFAFENASDTKLYLTLKKYTFYYFKTIFEFEIVSAFVTSFNKFGKYREALFPHEAIS